MSPENRKPDDRELDAFLGGEHPVSQEYRRLGQPSAPPALDDAVLRLAREAVALPRPVPAAVRWRVPLALAATVLLSLGTLRLMQADPLLQEQVELREPVPLAAVQAPPPVMADALPQPGLEVAAAPASRDARSPRPVSAPPAAAPLAEPVVPAAEAADAAGAVAAMAPAPEPPTQEREARQKAESKRRAYAAMAASPPEQGLAAFMGRRAAEAPPPAVEADADGVPDAADEIREAESLPACPPPEPEACDPEGDRREACFACVRRLHDAGQGDPVRALLRQMRERAAARGDAGYAVPQDLQILEGADGPAPSP